MGKYGENTQFPDIGVPPLGINIKIKLYVQLKGLICKIAIIRIISIVNYQIKIFGFELGLEVPREDQILFFAKNFLGFFVIGKITLLRIWDNILLVALDIRLFCQQQNIKFYIVISIGLKVVKNAFLAIFYLLDLDWIQFYSILITFCDSL